LLAPILQRDREDLFKVLTSDSQFVWIQRKIGADVAQKIRQLKLEGLDFTPEARRSYPKGRLLSHVLGFVGVDEQGLEGIELEFDRVLSGVDGRRVVERDARRRALLPLTRSLEEASDGDVVVTAIDEVIQHIVEDALDKVYAMTNPDSAIAIVQDPSTGEILAMACRPDFDPNKYRKYPVASRRNRAVTDAFEPGSSLKVVPTAALLQERLVDPGEVFYCEEGSIRVHGHIIRDFKPHGNLTFAEVVSESSNVGMIKAARRLSREQLYEYCARFGIGQKTSLSFPGEAGGILHPPARWSKLSIASVSIGQEVLLTPIQLVRVFSTIANDGIMMKPILIRQIEDAHGRIVRRFDSQQQRRAISRSTARQLGQLLRRVVDGGSGAAAALPAFEVAGKTGTAQKVDPNTGRFSRKRHVAVFCGFVPVDKPRLTILVLVDTPRVKHDTGGSVAAPVFREIAESSLNYLRVPPDRPDMPIAERGVIAREEAGPSAAVSVAGLSSTMPDLGGMSKLEVVQALSFLSLELSFEGSGNVTWQSIVPGRAVSSGDTCEILFAKDGMSDETYRFTEAGGSGLH
jgi:cell division protein FtsI (penicillin-binding protein 3)